MKIRNRLALVSSLTFGVVFSLASVLVYVSFYKVSERVIFNELERSSRLTAFFYLEEDELPQKEYREIVIDFENYIQEKKEVRVYDEQNIIRYGNKEDDPHIPVSVLNQVREKKQTQFKVGDYYYLGLFYPDNQGDFVLFVKENNEVFRSQSRRLLMILFIVLIIGLLLIVVLSRKLSNIAYHPISRVIRDVQSIDLSSLETRIDSPKTQDEVQDLVDTFNDLLRRLSDTFTVQRNFIRYVSHEFKTPLTAISGHMEVFVQKQDRSPEEQARVVKEVVENVHYIKSILNSLLQLSGLKQADQNLLHFRIDELLWELLEANQGQFARHVQVQFLLSEEEEALLTTYGDPVLIRMALHNILENALKYSQYKPVTIQVSQQEGRLRLIVQDQGQGIPDGELQFIQRPFYRGSNTQAQEGSGIGLSIAGLVLQQNQVDLKIDSSLGQGTTVSLVFPKR